ncbi:MucBP domain-containing protein [Levilactobacillus acidifarinae]|uniref:Gram-positive cocci surface proteins LPxTG domain-containing protein n=1 Tax=Levilactobacillus acidifarinae DSM 19394 = JCM 15949 TaxID=1423715 RepID=A0A0R1LJF6_9LACO|nr:MucBP domain-containing protein [Levilactobacillus acidifarinae]KRK96046.1 hypothetical protein FD25_GL002507 [Levilactobacillus acidifarinae DSM 19394]GEO69680.1 mucus-binding protein [Levilactobacillus acidifarinae]
MTTKKLLSKKMRQNRWVLTSAAAMTLALMSLGGTVAHAETTGNDSDVNETTTATTTSAAKVALTAAAKTTTESTQESTATSTATSTGTSTTSEPTTTEKSDTESTSTESATTESTPDTTVNESTTESTPDATVNESTTESTPDATGNESTTESTPDTTTDKPTTETPATAESKTPATTQSATDQATTTQPEQNGQSTDTGNQATTDVKTAAAAKAVVAPVAESATLTDAAQTIDDWMPNKKLQELVLQTLRQNNPGRTWNSAADITQEDMALLTRLSGDDETYLGEGIDYSLEGLQYATNLKELLLQSNVTTAYYGGIVDLSPLAGLQNLTDLQLTGNRIKDVTPIAGLKNLKSLGLTLNEIADFSPLKDNQYTSFYGGQQVIYLPSILVNSVTRTAHLDGGYKLPDGTTVALTGRSILVPVKFDSDTNQFTYKVYYIGGNAAQTSDGGLDYSFIQDPDAFPPATSLPGAPNVTIDPVDHYYYLTGAFIEGGSPYFYVIQPYELADPAATVTAKYQDEQGNEIAPSVVLNQDKQQLVGATYTTTQAAIDGYTFKETTGAPVTGTYAATAQTVIYVYTRDQGTVTVHYVDDQGNALKDPETVTGNQGDPYTTTAAEIPYYTLTTTPANATGVYGKENVNVTYVYTRDQGTVTTHYVDDQGNVLQTPLTVTGNQGDPYTTTAAEIPYYTLTTTPANATGVYGKDAVNVTYVYTRDQGTVTTHYVDDQGNVLQTPLTVTGNQGDPYTTTAIDIPHYTLTTTPTNATGVYGKDAVNVTYVYTRDQGTVTVHYVDAQGNALKTPVTLTGNQGDAYTTEAAEIPYYTLTTTPANATGTYGSAAIDVTYVYTQDQGTVTVHYVDDQGNILKDAVTTTGNQGDTYTTEAAEIPHYTLTTTPANATGVYGQEAVNVTYVYTRDQGTVTTHYVDEDGNVLQAATTMTGNQGDTYTTTAAEISGYTLTTTPANATGTYGATAIDVTYVYRKDATTPVTPPVTTGTVTVHYVDAQGNVLQPATTQTGTVGDTYTTTAATITGYRLTTTPANANGTYTAGNQDVTYVYTKLDEEGGGGDTVDPERPTPPTNPTEPTTPTKPTTPTPTQPDQVTNGSAADAAAGNQRPTAVATPTMATGHQANQAARNTGTVTPQTHEATGQTPTATTKLPQTNEQTAPNGWLAGAVGLLLSLLGLAGWRKKSE